MSLQNLWKGNYDSFYSSPTTTTHIIAVINQIDSEHYILIQNQIYAFYQDTAIRTECINHGVRTQVQ